MSGRNALLEYIARKVISFVDRTVIAIDGVDGSGKTIFADELAVVIEKLGRSVIRAGIDGFHNPRAIRYRRGRGDPEGYFLDAYNYGSLEQHLIGPFRAAATSVDTARFNYRTDQEVTSPRHEIGANSVLVLDGIFLHRTELYGLWDQSVFLEVPFTIAFSRMAARDGMNPDPAAAENHRYVEGQNIYFRICQPQERATYVVDNSDLSSPRLLADRSHARLIRRGT